MTPNFRVHPDVIEIDLRDAISYYSELGAHLPNHLSNDFLEQLAGLRDHPLAGRTLFANFRRVVLHHFP